MFSFFHSTTKGKSQRIYLGEVALQGLPPHQAGISIKLLAGLMEANSLCEFAYPHYGVGACGKKACPHT